MGTSIDCFFQHGVRAEPADIQAALNALMVELYDDVRVITDRAWYALGREDWHVLPVSWAGTEWESDPDSLHGEGPAGLTLDVYERVSVVGNSNRFHALYGDDLELAWALRRVLGAIARRLGVRSQLAVAAAGFGDTDRATDIAYYDGGSFADVCAALIDTAGPPARTWADLATGDCRWYLGGPTPE